MLWGRNYMFAKLSSHIFFPGFLVITFRYLKGPICQCSLIPISVSFTASGTLTPCSSRNNTLPVMHMTHSTWKVCWLDFLNCYIRFPTIHEKINKNNPVSFWLSLVIHMPAPSTTKELPEDYVERVKRVHECGGYGSRGYDILIYIFIQLFVLNLTSFL